MTDRLSRRLGMALELLKKLNDVEDGYVTCHERRRTTVRSEKP